MDRASDSWTLREELHDRYGMTDEELLENLMSMIGEDVLVDALQQIVQEYEDENR